MIELQPFQAGLTAFATVVVNFLVLGLMIVCRLNIAERTGLFDDPAKKAHARHKGKVPLIGGLAFVAAFFAAIIAGAVSLARLGGGIEDVIPASHFVAYLLLVALFLALGLSDDLHGLSARRRLVCSFAFVALLLGLTGDQFLLNFVEDAFLGVRVPFGPLAPIATGLAIIALVNAFNMSDGRNGIVAGVTAIWSIALALKTSDMIVAAVFVLCAINSLVLGWHNLKSRLFFGDAGTYAIAAMFGCVAIACHSNGLGGLRLTSLEVCSLFLVLVLDMIRLIILRTRAGRSPMTADHNHLHHRLDDHFGWPAGLVAYLALVALPVVVAFQDFPASGALGVGLGICTYLAVILYTRSPQSSSLSHTKATASLPES